MQFSDKTAYKSWLHGYGKRYRYLIVASVVLSFTLVALELLMPLPMKFLAGYVFGNQTPPAFLQGHSKTYELYAIVLGLFLLSAGRGLYTIIQTIAVQRMSQVIDRAAMREAFSAVTTIPHNSPNRSDNGTYLYQVTNQSQKISSYYLASMAKIIESVLMMTGVLVVLSLIDLRMAVITVTAIPLLVLSVAFFGRTIEARSLEAETAGSKLYGYVNETFDKLRTIQAFSKESLRLQYLNKLFVDRRKRQNQALISSGFFFISNEGIVLIATVTALVIGGQRALAGTLSFGDLLLFIAYINSVLGPLIDLVTNIGVLKSDGASLQQVHHTITESQRLSISSGTIKDVPLRGTISLLDVSYNAPSDDHVIYKDVTLELPAGSVNALIGPSGAGKTTLFNLLLRFTSPSSGRITIDGTELREYDLSFLRQHIAIVEQEPDIFELSYKDNIAFTNPDTQYNLPDVMGAAYIADITEHIEGQKQGYDTTVSNERLSGGQKQRIAAARAYYKRAPILLLDEPTSALDKGTARKFIDNLHQYLNGRTVLMITHDLGLLEHVDTILVVDDQTIKPISKDRLSDFSNLLELPK